MASLVTTGTRAVAQNPEEVLFNFAQPESVPYPSGLSSDAAGNLYGTTADGGANAGGTVFELSPLAGGGWAEKTLFRFSPIENYSYSPLGGVVPDSAGNLYGTTYFGGKGGTYGGTVFELKPQADGTWAGTVLHSFREGYGDGILPRGALIFDSAGNLYGTTSEGGSDCCGTVFELTPQADGSWQETVLHSFNGTDGDNPLAGVTLDAAGNLYGTTLQGGAEGGGTAFELKHSADGVSFSTLYNFVYNGESGSYPDCTLAFDAAGNLYGTTSGGGRAYNYGTVFELTPTGGGEWTETVVHYFGHGVDGTQPAAGLTADAFGNFYGTAVGGGAFGGGMVFRLTPSTGGTWIETPVHSFDSFGNGKDGKTPVARMIFDAAGNLYGTTVSGGNYGIGTVYEITP